MARWPHKYETGHIRPSDAILEIMRIDNVMRHTYPGMVDEGKITPYERDWRLAVNQFIIEHFTKIVNDGTNNNSTAQG